MIIPEVSHTYYLSGWFWFVVIFKTDKCETLGCGDNAHCAIDNKGYAACHCDDGFQGDDPYTVCRG